MTQRLAGKVALISAAAQGIGRSTALAFAAEGATVIATDINTALLSELDSIDNINTEKLDVTDSAAVVELIKAHPEINVLFNVAGFVHAGSVLDCTEQEWDFAFDLNVKSMYRTVKAVIPGMRALGGGSIINMASICAHQGLVNRFAYSASKAAVLGFTKSVARDVVQENIRCNAISPGTVQTPSLDERIAAFDDPVEARKNFVARQPMGRLGTAEEIAAIALYLAADESVFTTGQNICVDGGMSI